MNIIECVINLNREIFSCLMSLFIHFNPPGNQSVQLQVHKKVICSGRIQLLANSFPYSDIITIPPVDTQGLLNTVSIFYCEGHGVLLQWTVQGNTINNDTKQERGIEITTTMIGDSIASELRITAKPINNDIVIGCTIVLLEPFGVVTKAATFQVLGISPVTNLQLNINDNLLNTSIITWDPPSFSSYNHYHYNIIIEVNNEYILVNNTTQDLEYVLVMELCNMYNISVSAVNVSYSSTPEMIQHYCGSKLSNKFHYNTCNYMYIGNEFHINNTRIIFEDNYRCNTTIELEV